MVTAGLTSYQIGDRVCGIMQLAAYLQQQDLSDVAFGQMIGVTRQAVHRYKRGRLPQKPILEKIAEVTAGKVKPNDFLEVF